jgi:hypothetical protein
LLFLDHLEIWKKHQVSLVETLAEGKREELKTELELSLHLHKPRSVRITNDIHDVRKVELHDHQSRISVHIKGLTDELREQKELIISLWDYLDEMISKCSESLSAFHNELSQCSTVLSLKKALTGAEDIYDKNAAEFNEVYNARYELLVGKITSLAEANSEYISSLKLFSDGGNYTNNEISQFKPKLEKQGERINKYWTQCKEELEAIQQLRKERFDIIQMTKITNEYQHHLTDLKLLESINQTFVKSCQLPITSETLESNRQAKTITDQLETIKQNMMTSMDSHLSVSSLLLEPLNVLLVMMKDRVDYLSCRKKKGTNKSGEQQASPYMNKPPLSAIDVARSIMSYADSTGDDKKTNSQYDQSKHKSTLTARSKQQPKKLTNYETNEPKSFLFKIHTIITDTRKKFHSILEEYYCLKGSRAVTRPADIPDTLSQFMGNITERCYGYQTQAEKHRINSVDGR